MNFIDIFADELSKIAGSTGASSYFSRFSKPPPAKEKWKSLIRGQGVGSGGSFPPSIESMKRMGLKQIPNPKEQAAFEEMKYIFPK